MAFSPRRSKFGVDNSEAGKLARTYDGRLYASKLEANYARELDLRKGTKAIKDWSPQHRVPLVVNGKTITTMVIDFRVIHDDGSIELIETKGHETPDYKLKRKLFEALFPEAVYSIVKKGNIG